MLTFLRSLDPKLVSTLVTTALARAVLELGGDPIGDPLWNGLVALVVGGVVGYLWPNDGTVLRTPQESGNADPELLGERPVVGYPLGRPDREDGYGELTLIVLGAVAVLVVLVAIAVL